MHLRSQCLSLLHTALVGGFIAYRQSSIAAGMTRPSSSVRMHCNFRVIKPPPQV